VGAAVLLVFGARERVDAARAPSGDGVLRRYQVGETLREQRHANLSGVVLELPGRTREQFAEIM
jgi:hypothetical protein